MKTTFGPVLSVLALSLAINLPAYGQTAVTDPVGYAQTTCLANSDTRLSIPFTRPAEFTGTIQSVSAPIGTTPNQTVTITVAATPNWSANQFVYVAATQSAIGQPKTYYAIIGPNSASVTGTVNVTSGNKTVTGTGTTFNTQFIAGDAILVNGSEATVASVESGTSMTLVSAFVGTTSTGAAAKSNHSPKEGSYYTVTANGSNTLTVNLNGDSLSDLAASVGNTSVTLIPYWTLGTAFPASDAGVSFAVSTGPASFQQKTRILFSDLTSSGIDLPSSATYFNYNGAWRLSGNASTVSYDDTVLLPSSFFIIRNTSVGTTFSPSGSVYMNRISLQLDTQKTNGQDNAVAIPRPTVVALNDLGLIVSGAFKASAGTTTFTRGDTLLTYDNNSAGIDKSSSARYYYFNNGWRLDGTNGSVDYGTVSIPYGSGFTIRKAVTAAGSTNFWQNTRNY